MRVRATLVGLVGSLIVLSGAWEIGTLAGGTTGGSTGPAAPQAPAAPKPSSSSTVSGTFIGSSESTRYGNVQVKIVVASGKITDVVALKLTDQGGRSVQLSNRAAPILRSEILTSQTAKVNSVSGATYTTDAYLSSAQSAIDKAGL